MDQFYNENLVRKDEHDVRLKRKTATPAGIARAEDTGGWVSRRGLRPCPRKASVCSGNRKTNIFVIRVYVFRELNLIYEIDSNGLIFSKYIGKSL